ncbi:MAG: hypothetical protein NTX17_01225 [Candidatus Eisenbacteria bacterium]|nr:hypothetical protein [Candidatus Eisenbacteria bacterium]
MRALRGRRLLIALVLAVSPILSATSATFCHAAWPTLASVSATSATFKWTAPGDDGTVGRASQYDLRFSRNQIQGTDSLGWWIAPTTATCAGLPVPGEPGNTDSFVVAGLAPGNTYYFILRTADEVPNWSFFSNIAVVTTAASPDTNTPGDETPPPPVAGLTATTVAGGIMLTWSQSSAADVEGYLIYRSYSQYEYEAITAELVYATTYLDKDVIAGLSYSYSVTAVDNSGNESALAEATSATAPSVPPVATRLLAPFPDPCLSEVVLRYEIADDEILGTIRIFDIHGRLVRGLSEGRMEPGQYAVIWDLKTDNGERVAPGIYFCVLGSRELSSARKIAVLK